MANASPTHCSTSCARVWRWARRRAGRGAGLAVVFVGDNPASAVYVRNKRRACRHVWAFVSRDYDLPATATQLELMALIDRPTKCRSRDHGILVQLPLPAHIDAPALINRIDPRKDVDGFHPENIGRLALRQRLATMHVEGRDDRLRTPIARCVDRMRSSSACRTMGRPLVFELMLAGCTTTCCHRFTRDLPGVVARGDIVVVAVGRPGRSKGMDQARRGRDRCRHQSPCRWLAGRRRGNSGAAARGAPPGSHRCPAASGR